MTNATRTQPTNRWCTECGEEVRNIFHQPEGPGIEHCACTKDMPSAGPVEEHKIRRWRKL